MSKASSMEIPFADGDEVDALTAGKRYSHWKAGQRKGIKRKYNKRVRRNAKKVVKEEINAASQAR